jgi:glycosyltransferase involved in cell wall biosynthesis
LKKRIIVSVSNDLYSDQRVRKVCNSLFNLGFDISLLGRELSDSKEITDRPYYFKRFRLIFNSGALFYATLNIRLFFYLLFHKADVLLANDLDTLLPNFLISKLKGIPLVYDSHELFTEVPELKGRYSKKVWEIIESWIFPQLENVFTVNNSIADIYENKYGVKINVIKNIPNKVDDFIPESKNDLGIGDIGKYIILQGAGINIDRGAEELVESMKYVDNAILLIVGSGDVLPKLKSMVNEKGISSRVRFIDKQSPEKLRSFTFYAELGVSLDKDTNLNYRYSLPNKIFDYLQAGIPVLASNLPEIKKVVEGNGVGVICNSHEPKEISNCINTMLKDNAKQQMAQKIKDAASLYNWENQEETLFKVYGKFL